LRRQNRDAFERPLKRIVCACHGHDLMRRKVPCTLSRKELYLTTLKVLVEGKVRKGDRPAERNLSANLRANGQKQHSKAEPQGESAQHDEAHLDHCGSVNAVVVHRKIMLLSGEICPTLRPPRVVALYVVVHEAIEQKSADGIVVDSYLMMRRPEAKRGDHPLSSVLSRGRVIRSSSPRPGGCFSAALPGVPGNSGKAL